VRLASGAESRHDLRRHHDHAGLPKVPSAVKIDLVDGKVVGLF